MIRAIVLGGLVLGVAITSAQGQSNLTWTHPDQLYSLSFPPAWKVQATGQTTGDLFEAAPVSQGAYVRQCFASARPLPAPPGCNQDCLNRSVSQFNFGGSPGVTHRDINGVTVAEVVRVEGEIWARETTFALSGETGRAMHQLQCLAHMPINETEKTQLNAVLGSLKIEK